MVVFFSINKIGSYIFIVGIFCIYFKYDVVVPVTNGGSYFTLQLLKYF